MTIVPETRVGKIQFYETHLAAWGEDPSSIGVTPAAVAALADLVAEAREAYNAHQQAQNAARAATQRFHDAVRRMHAGGAGAVGGAAIIQQIKTFAQTTGDAGVYPRALLPPPAPPGRPGSAPPPGRPYAFAVTLQPTGAVELTWKCDNPDGAAGTIYQVRRQVGRGGAGAGEWTVVGTVGAKSFVDRTLPPGTVQCTYEVIALRSTAKGESARYGVHFGGGGGGTDALTLAAESRKLVA